MESKQYQALSLSNDADEGGLDLGQTLGVLRRRLPLIAGITVIVTGAAVFKAITDTPIYKAELELLTEPVTLETRVISSTNPDTLSNREEIVGVELNDAKLKILKSPRVIAPIVEELQSKYPGLNYSSLAANLQILVSQGSKNAGDDILQVSYRSNNPQQVRDVLDAVAQAYLNYSLETRQSDISRGIDFLEEQLPSLRSRVDEVQERLQQLRQSNNLIEPTTQAEQLSAQMTTFAQQQLETRAQLNEARLLAADLGRELSEQRIESAAASTLGTPRYQELLNSLLAIDAEIAQQSAIFSDESPQLETLNEQRQNLVPLLKQEAQRVQREVDSRIRELEIRDRSLTQTIDRINQDVKQLSVTTRDYTDLQRELEIASENLNQFIVKREALRIDAAQEEVPWELLTPPGRPTASSDSVKKNFVLGSILGLLMGVGAALAIDKLSNLLHTSKEVRELAQFPLLGIVPLDKGLEESTKGATMDVNSLLQPESHNLFYNQVQLGMSAVAVEAFRSMYYNIRLLNPDQPIRSLVVSSSAFGEGKSTVAINLAKAAVAMGRRVLLVDADLRSLGGQSQIGVNTPGLTDVISGSIGNVNQVIQRVTLDDGEDNLFVLASGSIPPDPSRILASDKMQDLMQEFAASFDLVIYDTPALIGLADIHILASSTSGVVLVAGLSKLKRSVLEQAIEQLKLSRTPVLGLVINRSKDSQFDFYNIKKQGSTQSTEATV